MAKFAYTARRDTQVIKGTIEAIDRKAAAKVINDQKLKLISLTEDSGKKFTFNVELSEPKVKLKDRVIFTRQLATMINAGVPLVRSLATLSAQTESKALKRYLPLIVKDVEGGVAFAEAIGKFPKVFDTVYVSMVHAGEEGGILDEILIRLAEQQEKDSEIRGKLKSALTYPAVVLTITLVAVIYLMTSVIPKIGEVIIDMAGPDYELPIYTTIMLGLSDFMKTKFIYILGGLVIFIFVFRRWIKTKKGRLQFDGLLIRIPILGPLIVKVSLSRFARTFSSLSSAGVNVLQALKVTADAAGNEVIRQTITNAAKEVEQGKPLSQPLSDAKFFPPILSQMVAVGEETGEIDKILAKLADFYDQEVDRAAESMTSIIEPLMIVVLGGIVGVVVLSVFGPISSISQAAG